MLLLNTGIDFSSPADSCILFAWWKWVDKYGCPSPHTTFDDDNSETFNSFTWIDEPKNQLHHEIISHKESIPWNRYLSPRIDSKESIPPAYVAWRPVRNPGSGVLKSLKIRALYSHMKETPRRRITASRLYLNKWYIQEPTNQLGLLRSHPPLSTPSFWTDI